MNVYTYATLSSPCIAGSYFSSNTLTVINCCSTNLCNTGTATDTTGYPLCYIGSTTTAASCSTGTCLVILMFLFLFYRYKHSFIKDIINNFSKIKTATIAASSTNFYMCTSASSCTVGGTFTYNGLAYVTGECCTTSFCNNSTSVYTANMTTTTTITTTTTTTSPTTTTTTSMLKSSATSLLWQQKLMITSSFAYILAFFNKVYILMN
jgi:hypothetical protein